MVGDNTDRNVCCGVIVIVYTCNGADFLHNVLNSINLEQVVNILHYAGKTLKSHTCINVLCRKLSIITLAVIVELCEYEIPYLDNSVTFSCLFKALERTVLFTSVKVYLRAGSAGSASVLPEVVCLAELDYSVTGYADFVSPDVACFIVFFVNRYPESVFRDFKHLCEILPRPCRSLVLEVIAE